MKNDIYELIEKAQAVASSIPEDAAPQDQLRKELAKLIADLLEDITIFYEFAQRRAAMDGALAAIKRLILGLKEFFPIEAEIMKKTLRDIVIINEVEVK